MDYCIRCFIKGIKKTDGLQKRSFICYCQECINKIENNKETKFSSMCVCYRCSNDTGMVFRNDEGSVLNEIGYSSEFYCNQCLIHTKYEIYKSKKNHKKRREILEKIQSMNDNNLKEILLEFFDVLQFKIVDNSL